MLSHLQALVAALLLMGIAHPTHAAALAEADELKSVLGDAYAGAKIVAQNGSAAIAVIDLSSGDVSEVAKFKGKTKRFEGLCRPWWTPDGKRIVFSYAGQAFIMNADGSDQQRILAKEKRVYEPIPWVEPDTGDMWIVFKDVNGKHWYGKGKSPGATYMTRLRDGTKRKIADFPCDGGLSLDGTHLGEAYGGCMIVDVIRGKYHALKGGQACNATMAPDNSYRMMHLYLPHRYFGIRDKYSKEHWKIANPKGSGEWQTPRWSNHVNFAAAVAQYREYKIVIVRISDKKTVSLRSLGGDWRVPHLWLPGVKQGEADTTEAAPNDNVKGFLVQLRKAEHWSPVLRVMDASRDKAVRKLAIDLRAEAREQLDTATRSDDIVNAAATLDMLAARFAGDAIGKAAKRARALQSFERELEAARRLSEIEGLIDRLRTVKGAKARWDDDAYRERNRALLQRMAQVVYDVRKHFADTRAATRASKLASQYALPDAVPKVANEQLVVIATIVATSKVPTAEQIAPYSEALTAIRYRVKKVLQGDYKQDEIVVIHWGMRDRKPTKAATWKPGMAQQLRLDRFNAHPELAAYCVAQDADDFSLTPYWALDTQDPR